MQKRNIITICGALGSGKSTSAKGVAKELGYPHYSAGDFMRAMAAERGITIVELNILAETDADIDQEIDTKQKLFMDSNDNFVIDSRIGWFFAPDSFKVFLTVDPNIAAERIFADIQAKKSERKEEMSESLEAVKERLVERVASEKERYKKYYNIEDYQAPEHFDLVIDTGSNDIQKVISKIIEGYEKWRATSV